jgi:hypothetical protein
MASAILPILNPDEFTVYDVRMAGVIDEENQTRLVHLGQNREGRFALTSSSV